MKQFSLKVESRDRSGRRASRGQRADGKIPAVVYGKADPRGLMIDSKTFARLYKQAAGTTALFELEEGSQKLLSLIQEVQRNRLTDAITHVDFLEVKANEEMRARVRVRTVGEAVGVKMEGALLEVVYPEISVRCLPKDLPEFIEVNVEDLHAGDAVFVRDLKAITGVKFADKVDQVVITCNVPEVEEEKAPETPVAGAAAAGAAPAADGTTPAADAKAADGTKAAAAPAGKDAKAAPAKDAKPAAKK
jgi:large subunit ribosomal protein L25